jgi:hypothetical protein
MTHVRVARAAESAPQAPRPQVTGGEVGGSAGQRLHLNCPRCGLTIRPKARWLTIEHCPRCLARSRLPVRLSVSTLPVAEAYPAGRSPASDPGDRRARA